MAQTLIKVDYTGLKCTGIYYVNDEVHDKVITRDNAPAGRLHKFVIRQTVTVEGLGKRTAKETHTKTGVTFYKALEAVIGEREAMRQRVRNDMMGISDDEAERQRLEALTVNELFTAFRAYKEALPDDNSREKHWNGAYARQMQSIYKTLIQPYIGTMRAYSIKQKHIEECFDGATRKGLKPRATHAIRGLSKQMFEWWITREELDKRNPASGIKLSKLKNERSAKVSLSWTEIRQLYTAMESYPDERYRQLWLWLGTGRRLREALKLERAHIHSDGYYSIIAGNNKARTTMIYRVPEGVTVPLKGRWVHTSTHNRDKHLQVNNADHHWHNVVQNANIVRDGVALTSTDIHKHDLRIIIATALAEAGVPYEVRAMVLGHTLQTVTDRYSADTRQGADLKHKAVTFFLDKVHGKIDEGLMWEL